MALRRAHPAFRMTDRVAVDRAFEFAKAAPRNAVEYVLKDHANGDPWRHILVVYNGNSEAQELSVPGEWEIVADDKAAGIANLRSARDVLRVEPFSLVVPHTEGAYRINDRPALAPQRN